MKRAYRFVYNLMPLRGWHPDAPRFLLTLNDVHPTLWIYQTDYKSPREAIYDKAYLWSLSEEFYMLVRFTSDHCTLVTVAGPILRSCRTSDLVQYESLGLDMISFFIAKNMPEGSLISRYIRMGRMGRTTATRQTIKTWRIGLLSVVWDGKGGGVVRRKWIRIIANVMLFLRRKYS